MLDFRAGFRWPVVYLALLLGGGFALRSSASTVQFARTTLTVPENGRSALLAVNRAEDLESVVTVDYTTSDGSALAGSDYLAIAGTLLFGPGETTQLIRVPILNDALPEGTESFQVRLANPSSGALLGTKAEAQVTILDNDPGIQVEFSWYSTDEGAGSVTVGIVRGPDEEAATTVDYLITDGTTAPDGQSGGIGLAGTVVFARQQRRQTIQVPITNNALPEEDKTLWLTLTQAAAPSVLGALSRARIVIRDNDPGVSFSRPTVVVSEDVGEALLTVMRGNDMDLPAFTVDYRTSNGTAKEGIDYEGAHGTLAFAAGEKSQTIGIPVLNNDRRESTRSFVVVLENPSAARELGKVKSATVWIEDNDPGVSFEQPSYPVWRNAGEVILTVLRGNDLRTGPLSVGYATTDETASAGTDYVPTFGLLEFAAGELVKTVTVPLLPLAGYQGPKRFRLTIGNPSSGLLGNDYSATIDILDLRTATGTIGEVAPPFDARLTMSLRASGLPSLSWISGGQLQWADSTSGAWQTLADAEIPTTVRPVTPRGFYRVRNPRPATLFVPPISEPDKPLPLLILLHAYGTTGAAYQDYMRLAPIAADKGLLFCFPDGSADQAGRGHWNGTDACCAGLGPEVDDSGYLRDLIEEIARRFLVDRKRIYLLGHSNGGFMAYRMACEHADLIAAIASLAGMTFLQPDRCSPSQPVSILHIHGTEDPTVAYNGGFLGPEQDFAVQFPRYPGALESVQLWAGYNGCSDAVTDAEPSLDLDLRIPGMDTVVTRYLHCPPGGAVELWTIEGGTHGPRLFSDTESSQFSQKVIDWLLAHPKP